MSVTQPVILPPRPLQEVPPYVSGGQVSLPIEVVGVERDPFGDLYHTLLTTSWWRLVLVLAVGWVLTNALFAVLFVLSGDAIQNAVPGSLQDAFFFAVQTSATIGYGGMLPKTVVGHVLVTALSFVSILQNAMAAGLMFAKFARPSSRIRMAHRIVVFHRDGCNVLQFRLANGRQNQVVEGKVRLWLLQNVTLSDGERIRRISELDLLRSETPIFALSFAAQHVMDARSPLHGATPESMTASDAQFIVTFTGLDESFGATIHARHSYSWKHLAWGYKYADLFSIRPGGGRLLDYGAFDTLVENEWLG